MKYSIIPVAFFMLISCQSSKKHTLWVENQSSAIIDSVVIKTLDVSVVFPAIPQGAELSKEYVIGKEYNSEGAFIARIYFHDTTLLYPTFGYYSNTKDIKSNIGIVIDKQLSIRGKIFENYPN